jgi:hypothetical protein
MKSGKTGPTGRPGHTLIINNHHQTHHIMNNQQRKQIRAIAESLETFKDQLEEIGNEERLKFDNMPESLQCSERGEKLESGAESLEELVDEIDLIIENLQNLVEQ